MTNSEECAKSELDLFSVPPTQTAVEEGVWDIIYPHPNFSENTTIRFDIPSTSSHYIDLSETQLFVECHLKRKRLETKKVDGVDVSKSIGPEEDEVCGVFNNFMHSLFTQVQVNLNNVSIENTNETYAYRAYLENLLCYNKEAKDTFLQCEGWYKDDLNKMNVDYATAANKGFLKRASLFSKTNQVQMCGRLHCDIFNVNRYLLNNVNLTVTLTKSKPEFFLKGLHADKFSLIIDSIYLKIRRVTVSPSVMLAHAMALDKTTAKYPIQRVVILPKVIPYSSNKFSIGVYNGVMPTRVVFGFVDTLNFDGQYLKNPFNFIDLGVKSMCLKLASKALPHSSPLSIDYAKNTYIEAYNTLFKSIRESSNDISLEEYKNGYCLYAFDLSPDLCNEEHYSLLKDGQLDLELTLSKGIESSISAIFYLEFNNIVEIDKSRQIIFDFKI